MQQKIYGCYVFNNCGNNSCVSQHSNIFTDMTGRLLINMVELYSSNNVPLCPFQGCCQQTLNEVQPEQFTNTDIHENNNQAS